MRLTDKTLRDGLRLCSYGKEWLPATREYFPPGNCRAADGSKTINGACRKHHNARAAEYVRAKFAARGLLWAQEVLRANRRHATKAGYVPLNLPPEELVKYREEFFQGFCQCCGESITTAVIDHDHITGEPRGWVCRDCNINVIPALESAKYLLGLKYLARHAEKVQNLNQLTLFPLPYAPEVVPT